MTRPINVRRAVNRLDKAAQAFAFKGSQMPELHEIIEKEYHSSKKALLTMFYKLMDKLGEDAAMETVRVLEKELGLVPTVAHEDTLAGHLGYPKGSHVKAYDTATGEWIGIEHPLCPKCQTPAAFVATEACDEDDQGEIFEARCQEHGEFFWQKSEPVR